jgi:hypothetical protein
LAQLTFGDASASSVASNASNSGLPLLGENSYFDFTSIVPEEAGCSAVAGWPDMG